MMPNLVPKNEGDDGSGTSGASKSINSLQADVGNSRKLFAADLDKLQKAYEEKIRTKCEKIAKLQSQKRILEEKKDKIQSLKAWSS